LPALNQRPLREISTAFSVCVERAPSPLLRLDERLGDFAIGDFATIHSELAIASWEDFRTSLSSGIDALSLLSTGHFSLELAVEKCIRMPGWVALNSDLFPVCSIDKMILC